MEPEQPGAAYFCLEPEGTKFCRIRSRLRTFGAGVAQKSCGSATLHQNIIFSLKMFKPQGKHLMKLNELLNIYRKH